MRVGALITELTLSKDMFLAILVVQKVGERIERRRAFLDGTHGNSNNGRKKLQTCCDSYTRGILFEGVIPILMRVSTERYELQSNANVEL